tara:strand:+ start:688 stop:1050 length:363 start_codon:yes stop_codon:yes gene_type:complete
MSKRIPDMDSKELGALVLHDPARIEEPYSRRSQVASAVLVPNHGHWVGYFDPDDMDRQPLYVRAESDKDITVWESDIDMWDKCQVSIDKKVWHSVGNRHGLGKFMMQWYAEEAGGEERDA